MGGIHMNLFRYLSFIVICVYVSFFLGCGTATKSNPDPVVSFKRVVENGINRASDGVTCRTTELGLKESSPSLPWVKTHHKLVDPLYDVQKTDSLVSPYVAKLTVKANPAYSRDYASKPEAEASNEFPRVESYTRNYEFNYAHQDGAWVLKSCKKNYVDKTLPTELELDKGASQGGDQMVIYFRP
jgi:hypothetical protein